jgi:hypothetical protein
VHYRANGYIVRSENAAKPATQPSGYVVELLQDLAGVSHALDYGCGKLRYAVHLKQLAKKLTLVDSEIQLSRSQVVCGETTTIRDYAAANWESVRVINHLDFREDRSRYGFILCANVLSTIPHLRTRKTIAQLLAQRLTSRGRCLFICQYTNSYFSTQMEDRTVKKFGDGFIKGRPENASFYGLIKPPQLKKLVVDSQMAIEKAWIHDQSGYVIATRR